MSTSVPLGALRFAALFLLVFVGLVGSAARADTSDEVMRTWEQGLVFVPFRGGVVWGPIGEILPWAEEQGFADAALPTVIYMHGCSGLDGISRQVGNFYAEAGFVVFAPDGFARVNKPLSCDPETNESGMHRGVLGWRQAELGAAIEMAGQLPFVDGDRIFAHGFSEGAITVATFEGQPLRGRLVEGWSCHAGWVEYVGINAPDSEPVLTLVAEGDPWFQAAHARGDCGRYLDNGNGSRSVVYPTDRPLGHSHYLMWHRDGFNEIMSFIEGLD